MLYPLIIGLFHSIEHSIFVIGNKSLKAKHKIILDSSMKICIAIQKIKSKNFKIWTTIIS